MIWLAETARLRWYFVYCFCPAILGWLPGENVGKSWTNTRLLFQEQIKITFILNFKVYTAVLKNEGFWTTWWEVIKSWSVRLQMSQKQLDWNLGWLFSRLWMWWLCIHDYGQVYICSTFVGWEEPDPHIQCLVKFGEFIFYRSGSVQLLHKHLRGVGGI